ncbi:MAG: hypothetical protein K2Y28_11590 [Burkholderiaceae bacterium]|nr:hypothetical protein [Burkholderiaceae bacterium]
MNPKSLLIKVCLISTMAIPAFVLAKNFANVDEVQESINSKIERLTAPQITKVYDEKKWNTLVQKFNDAQLKTYSLDKGNEDVPPKGFISIKLNALDQFFYLDLTITEQDHSVGVDVGEDTYRSIYFTKGRVKKVVSLAGPTFSLPEQQLQLSVPAKMNCVGLTPIGAVSVYDLQRRRKIYHDDFLQEAKVTQFSVENRAEKLKIILNIEEELQGGRERKSCDITPWVKKITEVYELNCDAKKSLCKKVLFSKNVEEGCSDIGGCD